MFRPLSILALAVPLLVHGAPVWVKRANSTDVLVLQFAGVLEQLESEFYTQALAQFQDSDFTAAGFSDAQVPIQQFEAIRSDEETHLSTINSTLQSLGASPVSGCQFDFSSALTNVSTMAATARVVENLGVSAYLGAANMISDPVILTAAASILSVEARHQTVLNLLNDATSIPQAFDIALTPSEVLAVASPFISNCDVGISANPTLSVTNTGSIVPGTALSFASTALNGSTDGYFCQMLVGGAATSISLNLTSCVVPDGVNGPVAIFVTSDDQPIDNNIREQNTNTIVAGPAMIFVDADSDLLGQLAVSGIVSSSSNSTSSSTNSTSTGSSGNSSNSTASSSVANSSNTSIISSNVTVSTSSISSASTIASASASSAVSATAVSNAVSSATSTAVIASGSISTPASLAGTTTETISPEQASLIISAASAQSASAAAATGAASSTAATAASSNVASASASASAAASVGADSSAAATSGAVSLTLSAASALATASSTASTDVVAYPGGPNMYTGPSADGSIEVLGWSTT